MTGLPGQGILAAEIARRLRRDEAAHAEQWRRSGPVRHLLVDDLLPKDWAEAIAVAFPSMEKFRRYESRKEHKGIGVEFDRYPPILKDITFAFQAPEVLAAVSDITAIVPLNPDANLYSGGLSSMGEGDFLNPHIDNSGNPFLNQYRRINALFYVSPGWNPAWGGGLELWDGRRANPITLEPRFNRLVLMNTNRISYHSVSPLRGCGKAERRCVSNYYFSPESPEGYDYFHVTSFRGRPEQPVRDLILRADAWARGWYRRFRPRTASGIKHSYK
jgi:Rps23 Pro-64 3,4-dihydroxylase Tpa1-like proline 4-hydroxylase